MSRRKRRFLTYGVVSATAAAAAILPVGHAHAATSCSYDEASRKVTITVQGVNGFARIHRNGSEIYVTGTACGGATVLNTDAISVVGSVGMQTVFIDVSQGPFEPGEEPEPSGVSEIELDVDLRLGTDELFVDGADAPDNIRLGRSGFDLNADTDVDITGGAELVTLFGNDGADRLSAAGGRGTGDPFPTDVRLFGGDGRDIVTGGQAADDVVGGNGADNVFGGPGADVAYGGEFGGGGSDLGDTVHGGGDSDYIVGGLGGDMLFGDDGDDRVFGEDEPDEGDTISGGSGVDSVNYLSRWTGVVVDLDGVADDGVRGGGEDDNILPDVENVFGSMGHDRIVGSDAPNLLYGSNGGDVLMGGGGADLLQSGDHDDKLLGGADADTLHGGSGSDTLRGEDGNDLLYPELDGDSIWGGWGDDTMYSAFFDGADGFAGGPGHDTASYEYRGGPLMIDLDGTADDGDVRGAEGDNIRGDVEEVIAGAGADIIVGNGADNILRGADGDDDLRGGGGSDVLVGEGGADVVTGGDGRDGMSGQDGADSFFAVDGGLDYVDGGEGVDSSTHDEDLDVVSNIP